MGDKKPAMLISLLFLRRRLHDGWPRVTASAERYFVKTDHLGLPLGAGSEVHAPNIFCFLFIAFICFIIFPSA